jgi:hypothetical protein
MTVSLLDSAVPTTRIQASQKTLKKLFTLNHTMRTWNSTISRLTARIAILGLIATAGFVSITLATTDEPATAADLSQFEAGNIISDSKFFDGNAMSSAEVQTFLNARVPTCSINNGQPSHAAGAPYYNSSGNIYSYVADSCLKDFRQSTPTLGAQAGACAAYEGRSSESAAEIIARVGQACNISQKVLLVLLQKEQILVSDTWPLVKQFNEATGFACYDNGQPCVGGYAGFFTQVWAAALQFQRYGTGSFTWYPVGQVTQVLYKDNNASCGTKGILIENRATAALYYYTPYTPNAAALAAGYGLGDDCSAYGNRNFYQMYVDWFGSTRGIDVSGPVKTYYDGLGGAASYLGQPIAPQFCGLRLDSCFQNFTGGMIFSIPSMGVFDVNKDIRAGWAAAGNENGWLGYPTMPTHCGLVNGGCYQAFEGGFVFWTAALGAHSLTQNFRVLWGTYGFETGWLAYPTSETYCGLKDGGCYQTFQGGYIFTSPATGAHAIKPEVRTLWGQYGFETGILGYPSAEPVSTGGSSYTQAFQGGTVSVSSGLAKLISTTDPWSNGVITNPWLGSAVSPIYTGLKNSGQYQTFQNGFLFATPTTGAHSIRPEVRTLWSQYGFETGALGYPTSDPSNNTTTYTQTFQGGTITVTNGVAAVVG